MKKNIGMTLVLSACLLLSLSAGANDGIDRYAKGYPNLLTLFPDPAFPEEGYVVLERDMEGGADGMREYRWTRGHCIATVRLAAHETYRVMGPAEFPMAVFDLSAGDCADPVPVRVNPAGDRPLLGFTDAQGNEEASLSCGGEQAPDVVYQVTSSFDGTLDATVVGGATSFDSIVSVRTTCDDGSTELSCDTGGGDDSVTFPVAAGTRQFVVVDGTPMEQGDYLLQISG